MESIGFIKSFDGSEQCPACSDQNLPTGAHKCTDCNKSVHLLSGCSYPLPFSQEEGYGQQRLCKNCYIRRENFSEDQAVENWKGLALPPKKRKRSSYLEPNEEFKNIDFSSKRNSNPIGLLRNGNTDLKPILWNGVNVILTNTCAYDSIIQIFSSAFSDSKNYENYVYSLCTDTVFQIIKDVALSSITSRTYYLRILLLRTFCESFLLPNQMLQIKSECTAKTAAKNLFSKFPSFKRNVKCTNSECNFQHTENISVITVMLSTSTIHNLKEQILMFLNSSQTKCTNVKNGLMCNGVNLINFEVCGQHIIVELINTETNTESDVVQDITISLNEIPKQLIIRENLFYLRGIISFCGGKKVNEIGHYVAICKRLNEHWEIYNDLEKKRKHFPREKKVSCQCLIYAI